MLRYLYFTTKLSLNFNRPNWVATLSGPKETPPFSSGGSPPEDVPCGVWGPDQRNSLHWAGGAQEGTEGSRGGLTLVGPIKLANNF